MTTMELNAQKQLLIEEILETDNPRLIDYLRKALDKFKDMNVIPMKRPCVSRMKSRWRYFVSH